MNGAHPLIVDGRGSHDLALSVINDLEHSVIAAFVEYDIATLQITMNDVHVMLYSNERAKTAGLVSDS